MAQLRDLPPLVGELGGGAAQSDAEAFGAQLGSREVRVVAASPHDFLLHGVPGFSGEPASIGPMSAPPIHRNGKMIPAQNRDGVPLAERREAEEEERREVEGGEQESQERLLVLSVAS